MIQYGQIYLAVDSWYGCCCYPPNADVVGALTAKGGGRIRSNPNSSHKITSQPIVLLRNWWCCSPCQEWHECEPINKEPVAAGWHCWWWGYDRHCRCCGNKEWRCCESLFSLLMGWRNMPPFVTRLTKPNNKLMTRPHCCSVEALHYLGMHKALRFSSLSDLAARDSATSHAHGGPCWWCSLADAMLSPYSTIHFSLSIENWERMGGHDMDARTMREGYKNDTIMTRERCEKDTRRTWEGSEKDARECDRNARKKLFYFVLHM